EDVDRRVAVFGPGVDREVGFGDDDDAADPERVELVEHDVDDGGLRPPGGFYERALHGFQAVDGIGSAIKQLEKQMSSEGVQSRGLPFRRLRHLPHSPGDTPYVALPLPLTALAQPRRGREKILLNKTSSQ